MGSAITQAQPPECNIAYPGYVALWRAVPAFYRNPGSRSGVTIGTLFWGDTLIEEDTLVEVEFLRQATSMEFAWLPGAHGSRASNVILAILLALACNMAVAICSCL